MKNNKENAQQKKTWITPELIVQSVKETEGKSSLPYESTTASASYGVS
jgi:hypothetical protein